MKDKLKTALIIILLVGVAFLIGYMVFIGKKI